MAELEALREAWREAANERDAAIAAKWGGRFYFKGPELVSAELASSRALITALETALAASEARIAAALAVCTEPTTPYPPSVMLDGTPFPFLVDAAAVRRALAPDDALGSEAP